jgi:hypothetical protein
VTNSCAVLCCAVLCCAVLCCATCCVQITSYFETTYKHEIQQYFGLLAYHASHADQWAKALRYKELAGAQAMAVNANPEAAEMYESAEDIMNKHGLKV